MFQNYELIHACWLKIYVSVYFISSCEKLNQFLDKLAEGSWVNFGLSVRGWIKKLDCDKMRYSNGFIQMIFGQSTLLLRLKFYALKLEKIQWL